MSIFLMMFLGFLLVRAVVGGGYRHRRRWERGVLDEKVAKLEAMVGELQEQAEQDRAALHRLEEERDFLRQLYPPKNERI